DFKGATNLTVGSLALDIAAGRIYWTAFRSTLSEGASRVWSARLDGTDIKLVKDTSGSPPPMGIALDLQNGKVYWGDYKIDDNDLRRIYRANLDGSGYGLFLVNPPGLGLGNNNASIAVDPDAGKVYWGGVFGLYRANILDGSE